VPVEQEVVEVRDEEGRDPHERREPEVVLGARDREEDVLRVLGATVELVEQDRHHHVDDHPGPTDQSEHAELADAPAGALEEGRGRVHNGRV